MTKAEFLEILKQMTLQERLEVIEAASQLIQQDLTVEQPRARSSQHLAAMAERMRSYYEPEGN